MRLVSVVKNIFGQLEEFGTQVISDKLESKWRYVLTIPLDCMSLIFSQIVQFRKHLYSWGIMKSRSLGCLVVVVGNLTVGGTGKTPIVEKFARSLAARGRKVAILSRGYKSRATPMYKRFWRWVTHADVPAPKVVSDGNSVLMGPELAGDEPYMLAKNLPGVMVLVDKDRVKAGRYAIAHYGADTLILDDGFQYLRLRGRLNLLLIDKSNPFGNKHLLPRGILREPIKHLKRASHVFLTKSDGKPNVELESTIRKHHPGVEIIECAHEPQYLESVNNGSERLALESLKDAKIAAFSGIAAPESFEKLLTDQGADLVYKQRFVDHYAFDKDELFLLFSHALAAGAKYVVTTQKDAVRIPPDFKAPIPLYYLRLEIEILKGTEDFENAVSQICFPQVEL